MKKFFKQHRQAMESIEDSSFIALNALTSMATRLTAATVLGEKDVLSELQAESKDVLRKIAEGDNNGTVDATGT